MSTDAEVDSFILGLALSGRQPPDGSSLFQLRPPWTTSLRCAAQPAAKPVVDGQGGNAVAAELCATSETVLSIYGALSGSWVMLRVDKCRGGVKGSPTVTPTGDLPTDQESETPCRAVRIFAVDDWGFGASSPPEPGVLYLSATLRRNLCLPWLHRGGLESVRLSVRPATSAPPFASKALIARVASPHLSARAASCRRQLSAHFAPSAATTALCVGDVFGVPLLADETVAKIEESEEEDDDDIEYANELEASLPQGSPILAYFVVQSVHVETDIINDLDCCGVQIDTAQTVLAEHGTVQMALPEPPPVVLDAACSDPTALQRLIGCWGPCVQANGIEMVTSDFETSDLGQPHRRQFPVSGSVLLYGADGVGKFTLVTRAAAMLGLHVCPVECAELALQGQRDAEESLRERANCAASSTPCVLVLRHLDEFVTGDGEEDSRAAVVTRVLEHVVQSIAAMDSEQQTLCVAVLVKDIADVSISLRSWCTHELELKSPSTQQRRALLQETVPFNLRNSSEIDTVAERTAALTPRDLHALIGDATTIALQRALEPVVASDGTIAMPAGGLSSRMLQFDDIFKALDRQNALRAASAIGGAAPSIPDIAWDDVGGLEDVKAALLDTIELPLKCPHLFADGVRRRSGVLLYGPPGTGKTLLAKAVASQCGLNFLSVKGPELINSYVGESERNVRELFAKARAAAPCVVFFDEIDALAPARGRTGDSGGVMDRITSQLLAEIDGACTGAGADAADGPVFMMGATNRPDLVDGALLRPGRFDALLYVYVPKGTGPAMKVLKALTRKMKLASGLEEKLPKLMTQHVLQRHPGSALTGADMYGWASAAYLTALKRTVAELIDGGYVAGSLPEGEAPPVVVTAADFSTAALQVRPSVSPSTLQEYEGMRARYSNTNSGKLSGSDGSSTTGTENKSNTKRRKPNTRRRIGAGLA